MRRPSIFPFLEDAPESCPGQAHILSLVPERVEGSKSVETYVGSSCL